MFKFVFYFDYRRGTISQNFPSMYNNVLTFVKLQDAQSPLVQRALGTKLLKYTFFATDPPFPRCLTCAI